MNQIAILEVGVRQLAVVRKRVTWSELVPSIKEMFDAVYRALAEHPEAPAHGPKVCVYRDQTATDVELEVGVELEARYAGGGLLASTTPACQAVRALHRGDYTALDDTHEQITKWCKANDVPETGMCWEVYGEWNDDPSHLITEVFHAIEYAR